MMVMLLMLRLMIVKTIGMCQTMITIVKKLVRIS